MVTAGEEILVGQSAGHVADIPPLAQRVADTFNALARHANGFTHWQIQGIPDLVFNHLLLDVLEHAQAVKCLANEGRVRAGYSNLRSAFESACDMIHLVESPSEYCERGALARAWELADQVKLVRRGGATKPAGPGPAEATMEADLMAKAQQEAADWGGVNAEGGRKLLEAFSKWTTERPPRHWSGLRPDRRGALIASSSSVFNGNAASIEYFYGWLSTHAHPGSSILWRKVITDAEGRAVIHPDDDAEDLFRCAVLIGTMALEAVTTRPEPINPAEPVPLNDAA